MAQRFVDIPRTRRALAARVVLALVAPAMVVGCGGRNVGTEDGDGAVGVDAQQPVDAEVPYVDPCAPMEATEALTTGCHDPVPVVGWAWEGTCCVPIHCICIGPDCDRLHATQSDCAAAHVPGCISVTPCADQGYTECEEQPGCAIIYYGGGCFSMEDCDPDGGDPDDWMCVERAIACVPTGLPCNDRERWDCDGDCFWFQHDSELCYEQCCFSEGFGYCTALPSCD